MKYPRILTLTAGLCLLGTLSLAQAGDIQAGKQAYQTKMCNLCHTLAGESGQMAELGGSLDNLKARRDADWIRRYLKDPAGTLPGSQMPPANLSAQEIEDLTTFLLSN